MIKNRHTICLLNLTKEEIKLNKSILKKFTNKQILRIIDGGTKYNRPKILKLAEKELIIRLKEK